MPRPRLAVLAEPEPAQKQVLTGRRAWQQADRCQSPRCGPFCSWLIETGSRRRQAPPLGQHARTRGCGASRCSRGGVHLQAWPRWREWTRRRNGHRHRSRQGSPTGADRDRWRCQPCRRRAVLARPERGQRHQARREKQGKQACGRGDRYQPAEGRRVAPQAKKGGAERCHRLSPAPPALCQRRTGPGARGACRDGDP